MKKSLKMIIYSIILLIVLGISIYLYSKHLYGYFLITLGFVLVFSLLLILTISKKTDEESVYDNTLKTILKRYDSILVETSTIPDFENKNVMIITNIEDMIDASVEIRKPIYYKIEENYTTFILLDNQDISLYILKLEKDIDTPIEKLIKERKNDIEDLINKAKDNKNSNNNIENTEVNTTSAIENTSVENNISIPFESTGIVENSNVVEQPIEVTPISNIEEGIKPIEVEQPEDTNTDENVVEEVQSIETTQENDATVEANTEDITNDEEPQLVPQESVVEDTSDDEEEIL